MPLGVVELIILLMVASIAVLVGVLWWKIVGKTGYSGWMGLLILLPVVNLVILLILAFGEWPIHRELEELRQRAGALSR